MRRERRMNIILGILCLALLAYTVVQTLVHKPQTYPLLDPSVSAQSIEDFEQYQAELRVYYRPLREALLNLTNSTHGHYSIYFEDLRSGASVGVNEREEYTPRSLFKVPTAAAVLKAAEEGEVDLDGSVTLTEAMLDDEYGTLYKQGAGYSVTTRDLLRLSLVESDNTANNALRSLIPFERVEQARLAMGVPYPKPGVVNYTISPKSYANVFRALYLSTYLPRPYSQYLLELLVQSEHDYLLDAGVPVPIAHKIGEEKPTGQYHDCGIIYHPTRPYLLCVMSRDSDPVEARVVVPQISKTIYDFVDG